MARRMFSNQITDSDPFIDMPTSAQNLYFHLIGKADDDDGFISNPKTVMRNVRASADDMNILIGRQFIMNFESGIIVIRHWRIHNLIRGDRYKPTIYQDEKALLDLQENKAYVLKEIDYDLFSEEFGCQVGNQRVTQGKLSKLSKLSQSSKDIESSKKYGEFKNVTLTEEEIDKLKKHHNYLEYIEDLSIYMTQKGKSYKSHYATIIAWIKKDSKKNESTDKNEKKAGKNAFYDRMD